MTEIAMLLDVSKCTACRACQVSCKQWNELPAETTTNRGGYENPPDLSYSTRTRIRFFEHESAAGMAWYFVNQRCLHCTDAACVNSCEPQALKHNEMGFVSYEKDLCIGCGYCAETCPFEIPRLSEDGIVFPDTRKMNKCDFCADRVTNDLQPACAKTCPTGAIFFGEREEIIAKGKARVAELVAAGNTEANFYGEHEMGGLHQMYVLPEKPAAFGLPENPQAKPLVKSPEIGIAVGAVAVGAVVGGLLAARARNMKKQAPE